MAQIFLCLSVTISMAFSLGLSRNETGMFYRRSETKVKVTFILDCNEPWSLTLGSYSTYISIVRGIRWFNSHCMQRVTSRGFPSVPLLNGRRNCYTLLVTTVETLQILNCTLNDVGKKMRLTLLILTSLFELELLQRLPKKTKFLRMETYARSEFSEVVGNINR